MQAFPVGHELRLEHVALRLGVVQRLRCGLQRVLGAGGSAPCQPLGAHSCALGTHGCLAGNTLRVGRLIGRQRARRAVGEEHTEEEYEANH